MMTKEKEMTRKPNYNISETDEAVEILVALPRVKKEDVSLTTEENRLRVVAQRQEEIPESWSLITGSEVADKYELNVTISNTYDVSNAEAKFEKNVLRLRVPAKVPRHLELEVN